MCDYNVEDIICNVAVFSLVIGYKHLTVLLTAFITVNTDIKTCMPQVSGLSKPDIIIQIEGIGDILCIVSLLMMPSFNHVNCSKHLLFNSNATSSYFHSACEPFAKDQNARGGTPIYHVPQPSSLIKCLTCLTFALTFWVNL